MAFLREQRNAVPVIAKQIAAINRRKPDYSGYFGTPEGIRTPDTRLRRAVLCPAELLAHMQFLFVSVTPAVENPPNVRRRPLYPTELRGTYTEIIQLYKAPEFERFDCKEVFRSVFDAGHLSASELSPVPQRPRLVDNRWRHT